MTASNGNGHGAPLWHSAFVASLALLQTRRFGTFFFATLLSNMGTWAQQVAEPWLLLSLGASSFLVGLDNFALGAPVFLLTLLGGVLADRGDRRRVIAFFQSVQMLCPAILVILLPFGAVHPWLVVGLSLVVGITDALSMPSFASIVPSLVERDQIPSALALNSTQFNLSRVLGPTLAGLVLAAVGPIGCFALNAASYVPFIGIALWILPRRGARVPAADRFDRPHLLAGARAIARDPRLLGALVTVLATSTLCAPLMTFCPVLVRDAFRGDVGDFSLAVGAFGAGGLLGAIALLGVDIKRDRRRLSSWFAVAFGAIVALAALDPWLWSLPGLLVVAGGSMTASNTSANTLLQATASPHLRGQTASLYMLAMRGGVSFGSLIAGASVHLLGVREALLINGAAAILLQLVVGHFWFRVPQPRLAN